MIASCSRLRILTIKNGLILQEAFEDLPAAFSVAPVLAKQLIKIEIHADLHKVERIGHVCFFMDRNQFPSLLHCEVVLSNTSALLHVVPNRPCLKYSFIRPPSKPRLDFSID